MLLAALCLRWPAAAPFLEPARPPPISGIILPSGVLELPSEPLPPPLFDEPPCPPPERPPPERPPPDRLLVVILFTSAVSCMRAGAIEVHRTTKSVRSMTVTCVIIYNITVSRFAL